MVSVDVSRAGEGQLEIAVEHGTVPNQVRPIDKGQFAVSFTPREARPHVVQITFNEEQCKCSFLFNYYNYVLMFLFRVTQSLTLR